VAAPVVTLETTDIQGLVVRGFGSLHFAKFLMLAMDELGAARRYLHGLVDRVNTAAASPHRCALQIAFTAAGLKALQVPKTAYETFSREFLEGMGDDVRAIALGDAPAAKLPGVHAMLMVYAHDEHMLDQRIEDERAAMHGGFTAKAEDTIILDDHKEHFGWRDGLSLPSFEGIPGTSKKQPQRWTEPLAPGEFVLGYLNEYGCYSESPTAEIADDPHDILPTTRDYEQKDLGRNGTYLVYRKMTQHVQRFWRYLATQAPTDPIALGAKMVGRWPNGAPLRTSATDDAGRATDNAFLYAETKVSDGDPVGLQCPMGAHIRRANPRDQLAADRDPSDSTIMVRKHQMIRRGRPYGKPISETMDPAEIMAAPEDEVERGLHFICLVGHISRQFEFVQRGWIRSPVFAALSKDGDPITGARIPGVNDDFTVPACPVRKKHTGMPQFTTLVAGEYFFLPGIRALRFLAGPA
jgi:Dyp-type peroxidase family